MTIFEIRSRKVRGSREYLCEPEDIRRASLLTLGSKRRQESSSRRNENNEQKEVLHDKPNQTRPRRTRNPLGNREAHRARPGDRRGDDEQQGDLSDALTGA